MPIPQHSLNLYRKPRQSSGQVLQFLNRYSIYNYRHTISANGWFDTASCDIRIRSKTEAETFFENFVGNRISVIVDNPQEPIFEGLINRITLVEGGVTYTTSLDEMANSVQLLMSTTTSASANTTAVQNLTSQGIYGIKQMSLDFGFQWGGTGGQPTAIGDAILASRAYPQSSMDVSGGNDFRLSVEIIGIYQTMKWQLFFSSSSVSQTYSAFVLARLSALSNTTVFFDNADTSLVTTNTATRATGDSPGKTVWDTLDTQAQAGDAAGTPWVVGVTPTNPTTGTRRLYYRAANSTIEYSARITDNLRVRNIYGRIVPPWLVRPDRSIQITDALIGFTPQADDPRITYINTVEYDAELQVARFYGYDDVSNEAAVNARNNQAIWFGKPLKVQRWRVS